MNSQDIKDYEEGCEIAKQITSVMRDGHCENYDAVQNWMLNNETSEEIVEKLSFEDKLKEMLQEFNRMDRDKMSDRFLKHITLQRKNRKRRTIIQWSTSAAALLAITFLLYIHNERVGVETSAPMVYCIDLSKETPERPTLKLEDGENIDLTSENRVKALHVTISDKKLSYAEQSPLETEIEYNTLIIPKLYDYYVELSDGTVVYLNANSELRYPTQFQGDTREVYLKGEGYFDVKKRSAPFIVHVEDLEIKVYGTKFNINACTPSIVKTVLISGSVGVNTKEGKEVVMKPNEMLVMDCLTGDHNIDRVDCDRYIAWVNGFFRYDDDRLETVLSEFSAWYGIKFMLSDAKQKDVIVTASILKATPLAEIISTIELATNLKFKKTDDGYLVN